MSVWYKVAWIPPLFDAFNRVWPNRGHAQDGTIGDLVHASGTSGHNPDDTPGVQAERQDADTRPEVRAADVDCAGVDMDAAVAAVLATPRDRDRLIYIIWNRHIWRASNRWAHEAYTGDDPHDRHAHFSGHPDADEDGAPWNSILSMGDDMEQSDPLIAPWQNAKIENAFAVVMESRKGTFQDDAGTGYGTPMPTSVAGRVRDIQAKVATLSTGGVDQAAINTAVRAALADPAVVGPLVKAINDDAARRLAE